MNKNTCYAALLCLALGGLLPATAEPDAPAAIAAAAEPAPAQLIDVNIDWNGSDGNISHKLKLQLDAEARVLRFSQLALRDFSPVTEAEARTGEQFTGGASHSGFTPATTQPLLWNFVVDVSGTSSRREKAIQAEIKEMLSIMDAVPEGDHIAVYALASNTIQWGNATHADERKALRKMLEDKIHTRDFGDGGSFRRSSLIYTSLRELIASTADCNLRRTIVLLSDGMDETGGKAAGAGERKNAQRRLIDDAGAAGISIHTLGYAQNPDDRAGGFSNLYNLSAGTGGVHRTTAVGTYTFSGETDVVHELLCHTHPCVGELTVQLPQELEDIRVTLQGKNGASGYVTVKRESIVFPEVKHEEPATEAIVDTEEKKALDSLLDTLTAIGGQLNEFQAKETATPAPSDADMKKLADDITRRLAEAAEEANKLKAMDREKLTAAANTQPEGEGAEGNRRELASKVLELCKDHPAAVEGQELLVLLGRTSPLMAEKQALISQKAAIAGGIATLVVLILLITLRRRKKAAAQNVSPEAGGKGVDTIHPILCELSCEQEQLSWKVYKPTILIGRNAGNDIILPNTSVSSSHCVLKLSREGRWMLSDLGSANGIYHRSKTVRGLELYDGCEFELGEVRLSFRDLRNH